MTNRLVPFLAFVLFLSLAVNLAARTFREPPTPAGPTRTALAAASEIPGTVKTPPGEGPILRVASLATARTGDATAIVSAADVSFVPGETIDVALALSLTRALLPEFRARPTAFGARLRVLPATGGLVALHFERQTLHGVAAGASPYSGTDSDIHPYPERWILGEGEPLVRIGNLNHGALVYVVLGRAEAERTDPGTLAYWRDLFRAAGRRPFLDETAVAKTADAVWPEGTEDRWDWGAGAQAPLNAALGLWILGDGKGLDELREVVLSDEEFADRALESMRRERHDEPWVRTEPLFALQLLEVLDFDANRVRRVVAHWIGRDVSYRSGSSRLRRAPPARIFRLLDDPGADGVAIHALSQLVEEESPLAVQPVPYETDLIGHMGRYALEFPPPADRVAVVSAWEAAREPYLERLPRTARLRASNPGLLALILVAIAGVSVAVALLPGGRRTEMAITFRPVVILYALTVLGMLGFEAGWYVAPAAIALILLWHWGDVDHPWWERTAMGVAVFSALVRIVFQDQVEAIHPAMLTVADAWIGFSWLVLGRVVLETLRDRDVTPFRWFLTLHVLAAVQSTGALLMGQEKQSVLAVYTTIGVASAALLWFSWQNGWTLWRERAGRTRA